MSVVSAARISAAVEVVRPIPRVHDLEKVILGQRTLNAAPDV
jgi:hypothetical protein